MKKIWNFLKHHLREDFHPKHYLLVATLLIALLSINYAIDFEDNYLDSLTGFKKFTAYFIFYAISYVAAIYLYAVFQKKPGILRQKDLWIKVFFGLVLLSLDSSVPFLQPLLQRSVPNEILFWAYKVSINMISFVIVFIPIVIFYFLYERFCKKLYGLKPQEFDAKPYFIMLVIMLPLMICASYTEGFLRQYPMYKITSAHLYLGVDEWVTVVAYELAYGLDFITVEFLFRGFFVIALANVLGRGAVLSMAVLYCTLHFGKPMGEAISSIAGGYILGVIAYETKSIWGGVIVHIGLAWLMEAIAYLHKIS